MNALINIENLKTKYQYAGFKGVAQELGFGVINQLAYFEVLHGMSLRLAGVDSQYWREQVAYETRFLAPHEVRALAKRGDSDLDDAFLDEALGRGDRCYAVLDGERLASYGWYSHRPTRVTDEFCVDFNRAAAAHYVYMHRGYTLADYRGKRLHAIGMSRALKALTDEGYEGLVSIVAANNSDSLKSTRRLGYRDIGKLYMLGRMGRYVVYENADWRREGMKLMPDPDVKAYFLD